MQNDQKKKRVESAEPSLNQKPKTSEDKCEVKTLNERKDHCTTMTTQEEERKPLRPYWEAVFHKLREPWNRWKNNQMKLRRSQPRPCQWMNQTEDEDEDEHEEDEQQSSKTKHEPNEEKKELLMRATTYQEGRKARNRWKHEAFKRCGFGPKSSDRSRIRAFFWRTRKRRKRKWKGPRKRTFSRELAGGWRRWRLSPSFKFFHVSLTSFRLVRSRCSHAAHSTTRQSKRYGEQHLSFWLSLFFFSHKPSSPFPSVTDGYDLSFGRSCGSHRSGLERNSSPVVMELG